MHRHVGKGGINRSNGAGFVHLELLFESALRALDIAYHRREIRVFRIYNGRNCLSLWYESQKQFKPLCHDLSGKKIHTSYVGLGAINTANKTDLDWVRSVDEHNRN